MGIVMVKTMAEMSQQNRLWAKRVKASKTRMLLNMAQVNVKVSQNIAKEVNFKGTLVASIKLDLLSGTKIRVISSTDHGYGIEMGIPPSGGPLQLKSKTLGGNWIRFSEQPLLESWVRHKLMSKAPEKAKIFLKLGAVPVGHNGYPFGYSRGLRFMETGYFVARGNSERIVSNEIAKLNA